MSKKKYRITNWSRYNQALKDRGSLTVWIEKGFEKVWYAASSKETSKRGRPYLYSDSCIKLMATVRHVFKLALRQLEGFLNSLFSILKVDLRVPEFSRLSRRMIGTLSNISYPSSETKIHLVIDSSGLKVYGEKEWIKTKNGREYFRRVWRKIHIGIDGKGIIRSSKMTTHKTDDRTCLPELVDQAGTTTIEGVLADSGYDSHKIYHLLKEKNIKTIISPPRNAQESKREDASQARNETIHYINEKGIHAWKAKHKYGRRNRVENTFYRLKTIFGRQFKSRTWNRQKAKSRLMCFLLNQMTLLGMTTAVKIS